MKKINNKFGFSILESLIAIGIMTIVMAGFIAMMSAQNKETKAMSEVIGAQDLQKSLSSAMSDGAVCKEILKTKNFNAQAVISGSPQEINLGTNPVYISMINPTTPGPVLFKKGDKASVYSSSLVIESIKLFIDSGAYSGNTGSFVARWEVQFDRTKMVRALRPVTVATTITADTTNPTAALIASCNGGSASSALINPSDIVVVWGPTRQRTNISVATCPADYIVLSGGANYQSSCCCGEGYRFVTANRPSADKKSWEGSVECANHRTVAYCIKSR